MDQNRRINAAQAAVNAEASRRRQEALKLRQAGKSLKEIGDIYGVSRERARQMVVKAIAEGGTPA